MRSRVWIPVALVALISCAAPLNYTRMDGPRYTGCGDDTRFNWSPRTGNLGEEAVRWPETPSDSSELRVASFNIQFSKRIDEAIALIGGTPALSGADILLLQEMDERGVRRIASEFGYCWVYYPATVHPRTRRRFGNAILSRFPFVEDHKVLLPHLGQFGKTLRIAVGATVDVHGIPVRVYSLHLATLMELGPERRRDQARAVVEDAAGFRGPVLVGGDFNEYDLGEVFTEAGYDWMTRDIGRTTDLAALDHFFVRDLTAAPGSAVGKVPDEVGASDHLPIWARFLLPEGERACDCAPGPDPKEALRAATAVFQGNVIGLAFSEGGVDTANGSNDGPGSEGEMVRYRFLVEKTWKGAVPDTLLVYSRRNQDNCGFPFFLGNDYLVYCTRRDSTAGVTWPSETEFPVLVTDACTRTCHLSEAAEDLAGLGLPRSMSLERERILIRKLQGRDTRSLETVPGGEMEQALYSFFHRWLETPPEPFPFDPAYLPVLRGVTVFLEDNIRAAAGEETEAAVAAARAAPTDAIGLDHPIRIVDVTEVLGGGYSSLVVLEGGGGRRLTVIKRVTRLNR